MRVESRTLPFFGMKPAKFLALKDPSQLADQSFKMGLSAQKPSAMAAVQQTQNRRLKKGELLFAEGENSRAMYLIKSGMIRLFKKKGDSAIELDTVRSGQILGELAFLDGNPRSASAEALTDCELSEVSGQAFTAVLTQMPDWLKILLKTVVGRLRTASTRIRQLESASTSFDYSDKDGGRSANYIYLSPIDVLKIASGIVLVASRNGTKGSIGTEVRVGLLQRYCNQIMGVPVAKITSLIDILAQAGVMISTEGEDGKVYIKDIDFLEQAIAYFNEENLMEPSKRHDLSPRGFFIMSLIGKHMSKYKPDEKTGYTSVNLAEVKKVETAAMGREAFRMDELQELVKLGYASNVNIKSGEEAFTLIKMDTFLHSYKVQRIAIAILAVNEQKRKGGNSGRS
jgi:CRP/FNR family cyclic AMP-dependent transcriptional regulator